MLILIVLISLQLAAVSASPGSLYLSYLGKHSKEENKGNFDFHKNRLFDKNARELSMEQVTESLEIIRYIDKTFKFSSVELSQLEKLLMPTSCEVDSMIRKSSGSKVFVDDHPNLRDILLENLANEITECIPKWFPDDDRYPMYGEILKKFTDQISEFEHSMSLISNKPIKYRSVLPLLAGSIHNGFQRLAAEVGDHLLVHSDDTSIEEFRARFESELENLLINPCQNFINQWGDVARPWVEMALQSNHVLEKSLDDLFSKFMRVFYSCQSVTKNPEIMENFVDEKYKYLNGKLDKTFVLGTMTLMETRVALELLVNSQRTMDFQIPTKFASYLQLTNPLSTCEIDTLKSLYQVKNQENNGNLRLLLKHTASRLFGICLVIAQDNLTRARNSPRQNQRDYTELDELIQAIDVERIAEGRGNRFYDDITVSDYQEGLAEYFGSRPCCTSRNVNKIAKSKFANVCKPLQDARMFETAMDWKELVKLDAELASVGEGSESEKYLKRGQICHWILAYES